MKLTIFDLDNTILNGDSDYSWIEFLIKNNYVDAKSYEEKNKYFFDQYHQGTLDIAEYAGFSIGSFIEIGQEKLPEILDKFLLTVIEPMINIYALRLIHKHYENDDQLLLASATNKVLVDLIAKRLEFPNVIATIPEQINGTFTGKILEPSALGEGKLLRVKEWMDKNGYKDFSGTTFYSDSINDLPLLESVEKPIAVNPDEKLREISINNSWEIVDLP
ncbi:HAD-IB family hydrolase [Gammaproteobacteria bacterium]|nr:HAD-IB family hydrolase [Gammaproteobacteria bacterium]MDC1189906.1 HAD-IB family hydrolase [Gammaproteobacteria bacterium]